VQVGDHGALRQLPVLVLPSAIQDKFSERAIEIRAFEIEQAKSRKCLHDVFQSISHRAFSEEL
jgi:hypothetical protein